MSEITIKIKETVNYDDLNEREKALYDAGFRQGRYGWVSHVMPCLVVTVCIGILIMIASMMNV